MLITASAVVLVGAVGFVMAFVIAAAGAAGLYKGDEAWNRFAADAFFYVFAPSLFLIVLGTISVVLVRPFHPQ